MAQVRNVSPNKLMPGNTPVGVDELYTVDDAAFLDRAWPTSTWALVTPPSSGYEQKVDDAILWTSQPPEQAEAPADVAAVAVPAAPAAKPAAKSSSSSSTDNAGDGTSSESE